MLKKKNEMGGISLPNFKTNFTLNHVCVVMVEDRLINEWNRMENPETDPYEYAQLLWGHEGAKVFQWRK